MNLGVRIATANAALAAQFQRAMDFWSTVIDMRWHADATSLCAVQLLDGEPQLFEDSTVAKSHLSERSGFQGWIAFNAKAPLTRDELFLTAVHELGHLLGLPHNPDTASVMYYTNREGPSLLDAADLLSLSTRHRLRDTAQRAPVTCVNPHFVGAPPIAPLHSFRRRMFSNVR